MSTGETPPSPDQETSDAIQAALNAISVIASSGVGPLTVTGDAGSVTQRSAKDLIAIANYLAAIAAASTRRLGVRYTRLIPDSTVQGPRPGFRTPWTGFPDDWNGYGWP
jgi:hypothetical protein